MYPNVETLCKDFITLRQSIVRCVIAQIGCRSSANSQNTELCAGYV